MKQALTTGDIAKFCGVNLRTVIRWIDQGKLNAYKLPGRGDNRVQRTDFLAFLTRNDMPVPQELVERGNRVLIVEDESAMASAIQRVLRPAGYETEVASDGFQAGALLGTFKPAVLTLDLNLPGLPGMDVLRFVRNNDALRDTRILVVSAKAQAALDDALACGADAALAKPFDNGELLDCVNRLCHRN